MAVRAFFVCLWQFLIRTPRVLWVCRIPAVSAIGGGLLLAGAEQTRDLFADLGLQWWRWLIFFLLTLCWAWIVHWAGRHALRLDDWVPDAHVPGGIPLDRRPTLQAKYRCAAVVVPRLLSTLVFVSLVVAMVVSYRNLYPARDLPEAGDALALLRILIAVTSVLGLTLIFLLWRRTSIVNWLHRRTAKSRIRWPQADGPLLTGHEPILIDLGRMPAYFRHATAGRVWLVDSLVIAVAVIITATFVASLFVPHWIAETFPRALFVPLMLGSSVLFFTEIGALAMRLRTPLLLILLVAGGVAQLVIYRFNDVRWTRGTTAGQHITISEAVKRWRQVNNCAEGDSNPCPRPIIIAAAGGASRAAFMTATVVGAMLDLSKERPTDFPDVRKHIFGLSSVSGSSAAAAVIVAALRDAQERGSPDSPPCQNDKDLTDTAWFGTFDGTHNAQLHWRDCLQRILAGDALSPVFVGLVYRDSFPLGDPFNGQAWWSDRAVLLEQALERRYKRVVEGAADICRDTDASPTGLCRNLGYHPDPAITKTWLPLLFINGTSVESGRRIIASDVYAGSPRKNQTKSLFPLAYDLCDIRAKGSCTPDQASTSLKTDIRLSTAVSMSARFPIISPYGTLRGSTDARNDVVDRVVDGGYFENDGLATAGDVADTLKEFGLDPLVILITNDPDTASVSKPARSPLPPLPLDPPLPLPDAESASLFDNFTAIVRALYDTRSGHEDGDLEYVKSVVASANLLKVGVHDLVSSDGDLCRERSPKPLAREVVAKINPNVQVTATMKDVSMSWWMSQAEQGFLDRQVCLQQTSNDIEAMLRKSAGLPN